MQSTEGAVALLSGAFPSFGTASPISSLRAAATVTNVRGGSRTKKKSIDAELDARALVAWWSVTAVFCLFAVVMFVR